MLVELDELVFEASRASGPGGQNLQKTSSRVTLRFSVSKSKSFSDEQKEIIRKHLQNRLNKEDEVVIHVQMHRSQHRNKMVAIKLLQSLIDQALKPKRVRKKTKKPRRAHEKRLTNKKNLAQKKLQRKSVEF